MNTLLAATELHPEGVEWEPLGRQVTMGEDKAPDQVRWTVFDAEGKLVDWSANLVVPDTASLRDEGDWRRMVRIVSLEGLPAIGEGTTLEVGNLPQAIPEGFSIGQIPSETQPPPDRVVESQSKRLVLLAAVTPRPVKSALWHFGAGDDRRVFDHLVNRRPLGPLALSQSAAADYTNGNLCPRPSPASGCDLVSGRRAD